MLTVRVLDDPNEDKIFIGENNQHKIVVFNSDFELKFQLSKYQFNYLKYPNYIIAN